MRSFKEWFSGKIGLTQMKHQLKEQTEVIDALKVELYQCKQDIGYTQALVDSKLAELKEYSRVDADVGVRGNNTVILTGVMHSKGYMRFWDLGDGEFKRLADQLKDMQGSSLVRHIDKPQALRFHGMFDL